MLYDVNKSLEIVHGHRLRRGTTCIMYNEQIIRSGVLKIDTSICYRGLLILVLLFVERSIYNRKIDNTNVLI